jgi:aldehyde dehydrogenase (NAD+)
MDVDAVWSFGAAELSSTVERASAANLKRTWVNNGMARDWFGAEGEGHAFLQASTEVKNVWVPYGE